MFYDVPLYNKRKMIYMKGQQVDKIKLTQEELAAYHRDIKLPQWPAQKETDNYTVAYPILAYKSILTSDNEIVICNLVINKMQKFVNISPYKFVQFVDTGMVPETFLNPASQEQAINISIYFLVELDSTFYLMNYRCFPWPMN